MFYRPEDGHGLPHSPFHALIAPRPIAWISTRAGSGDNLAPFSFFNAVSSAPPMLMFSGGRSHSVENARESGVFAVNVVEAAAIAQMNATSARLARGVDEFGAAGVAKAECATIDCPRVADAPATLECRVVENLSLPGGAELVFGRVTGIHIRDDCLNGEGRFDATLFHQIARLGYLDYASITNTFSLARPD